MFALIDSLLGSPSCSGMGRARKGTYAAAALRPRPLEPPVTTATLPLRENKDEKSWSCASAIVNDGFGGCDTDGTGGEWGTSAGDVRDWSLILYIFQSSRSSWGVCEESYIKR